ncbi:cell division ATPase MinD [Candidatus Woesearchaeota archaeon]|nr:cell division ATPase MinD [Candidatus Woesearchaeota archaeon]
MTHFIAIAGAKGGIGKTTTALNLAAALKSFNHSVIVVDGNISTPNIGLHVGVSKFPINLHHALSGKNHITEAIYNHPSGISIVPASISIDDLSNAKVEKLPSTIRGLTGLADFVLIDTSAGLSRETLSALKAADSIIVVTNPEMPSVTEALKTIKLSEKFRKDVLGVVVTRTKKDSFDLSIPNVETLLEKPVIGVVPEDIAVRHSLYKREFVINSDPKAMASISYKKLAANLLNEEYNEEEEVKRGFFSRLFWK